MDFQNGIPIYTQVINAIKEQLITGERCPGDKLPSSRELAQQFRINPNTAARVYAEMDSMGLTFTKRGIGTFVTTDEEKIKCMRESYTEELLDEFISKMKRIGYDPSQLPKLLESFGKGGK